MGKHENLSSCNGAEGNLSKERVDFHVSCETGAPGSRTYARDGSKEYNSDLTIERGNPISHSAVYFRPPGPSKISRPRSPSANDMEEMSKRPAVISDGLQPSAVYQSSYLQLQPSRQSLPANMFHGAHRSSDQHLIHGRYLCRMYGSFGDSLPRTSLTCHQKSGTVITNPYPGHGSTSFINASEILSYKWENSVPFRSSFSCPRIDSSSSQTLYDPLVDSIKSSGCADSEEMKISPENSPAAASNNLSGAGENSPDYDPINYSSNVKPKIAALEEVPNEVSSTNRQVVRAWPVQPGNRDSAELKIFRFALAEFIKELVKPAWKKKIISNDAHKMLVKKASDKVVSSVQPHQVPNSQEAAKQYITMYKAKIEKLVEGYMEVYCKRDCSAKSKE